MFQDIKSILSRSLRQKGINEAVEAAQVVELFRLVTAEKLGAQAVNSLRQVSLRGNVLQVSAGSSVLASELRMRENEILHDLADKLPGKSIRLSIFA